MDTGELRNVDLAAATSIRFPDAKLQLQFKDYLAALTGARSQDKRSVYIDSTDSKSRDVQADYIIPMPAWKSSYRLLFADTGQPTLEGWAIVDNTTGEDWTNVHLSLVSGKPISAFISQLYAPNIHPATGRRVAWRIEAVAPTVHTGAVQSKAALAPHRHPRLPSELKRALQGALLGAAAVRGSLSTAGYLTPKSAR